MEILKTILRWYIDQHDETELVLPFRGRHKKAAVLREGLTREKRFMLPDEFQLWLKVLKEVAPKYHALGFVQGKQLLRISEVAAMKWSNLNLKNRTYRICEHVI